MFAARSELERLHHIEAGIELGGSRPGREEQRRRNQDQDAVLGYQRRAHELRTHQPAPARHSSPRLTYLRSGDGQRAGRARQK